MYINFICLEWVYPDMHTLVYNGKNLYKQFICKKWIKGSIFLLIMPILWYLLPRNLCRTHWQTCTTSV